MAHVDRRDLVAGLLLAALGVFVALYAGSHYTLGTAGQMGPGYFPVMLGWLLAALGTVIALLSLRRAAQALQPPPLARRALVAVPVAVLVFSALVERVGLVPATVALTFIATAAERPYRVRRTAVLSLCLALLAWLIFSVGLGMTLPAFAFRG